MSNFYENQKGFFDTQIQVRKLIAVYSKTRPGYLSPAELAQFFKDIYQNISSQRNLSTQELTMLVGMIDADKDRWIGQQQLTKVVVMYSRRRSGGV